MQEMEVAREAARIGGAIVARYFREGVTIRSKESYNLVSDADVESEQAIGEYIQQQFPDHAILGEEMLSADISAEKLWIVDPLDGTNNFAHQIPHFAISIAYYENGRPVCGVVHNPIREETYEAIRGSGTALNGRPASVSPSQRLDEVLIGVGFYYDRGTMMEATLAAMRDLFQKNIHGFRRFGTASLDLCHVASGLYGAYFEYELSPWDFAAGRLILEEAGGKITTCTNAPLPLTKTSVLASNTLLHNDVLEVVQSHWCG